MVTANAGDSNSFTAEISIPIESVPTLEISHPVEASPAEETTYSLQIGVGRFTKITIYVMKITEEGYEDLQTSERIMSDNAAADVAATNDLDSGTGYMNKGNVISEPEKQRSSENQHIVIPRAQIKKVGEDGILSGTITYKFSEDGMAESY